MGGALAAVETGYMKSRLVESTAARIGAIAAGEQKVVGVNCYTESAPSPLTTGEDGGFLAVDAGAEAEQIERLQAHRAARDAAAVAAALAELQPRRRRGPQRHAGLDRLRPCRGHHRRMGQHLREVFGEYRAPTGVAGRARRAAADEFAPVRARVDGARAQLGRRLKMLVGKPGLDGHSNGAEQIAVAARDSGIEVVYEGIRLTPARIANAALEEGVHIVGLSILSGSHMPLVKEVLRRMRDRGIGEIPVVVGGIIPPEDAKELLAAGVARVYTPKDFQLARVMAEIIGLLEQARPAVLQPA